MTSREQLMLEALAASKEPMTGRDLAKRLGWSYGVIYIIGSRLTEKGYATKQDHQDEDGRVRTFSITNDGKYIIGL